MKYQEPIGAAEDASYVDADPAAGVEGSAVPASAIEHGQREIVKVLKQMGLTPADGDLTQLWQAVQKIYGKPHTGDPNGNVAADVLYERCWDTSTSPAQIWIATAADGTVGGTSWERTIANRSEFAAQYNDPGFQKLPGGLILQWAGIEFQSSNPATFTYPITFPNATLGGAATEFGSNVRDPVRIDSYTPSSMELSKPNPGSGDRVLIIVLGY